MASSDCPRPATARENREYYETIDRLGGSKSPRGRAFIESEHQKFQASRAAHNRQAGFWHWLWHG
jgi:hypothetical protein